MGRDPLFSLQVLHGSSNYAFPIDIPNRQTTPLVAARAASQALPSIRSDSYEVRQYRTQRWIVEMIAAKIYHNARKNDAKNPIGRLTRRGPLVVSSLGFSIPEE